MKKYEKIEANIIYLNTADLVTASLTLFEEVDNDDFAVFNMNI